MLIFGNKRHQRDIGDQPPPDPEEPVAITGLGFCCPVGGSAWEAAVALRKRRSAFSQHETVLVAADRYRTVLRGATISRAPEAKVPAHLEGVERAVALLAPALQECATALDHDMKHRVLWNLHGFLTSKETEFHRHLSIALPDLYHPKIPLEPHSQPELSRCAFFEGVIVAAERLRRGRVAEAPHLVGCVDSLCSVPSLQELCLAGRLKSGLNPEGIMAGEAAGAILLERESEARRRGAHVLATIVSWGRGAEEQPRPPGKPATGRGLTAAFREAFSHLDDGGRSVGMVVLDLNGERDRALEWAYTESRVFPSHEPVLKHPADTLGDCGGAMGAAILLQGLASLIMHSRGPRRVALCTSDDAGTRRVIVLQASAPLDRRAIIDDIRKSDEM